MNLPLTKDEVRLLRATNVHEGSYVFEIASLGQITPSDALVAAQRLHDRGFVDFESERRFIKLTPRGIAAREDVSRSSIDDPHLRPAHSYIVDDADAPESASEMSESELTEAIESEISKYE